MSHGLHYGSGVFEGIKCYKGAKTTLIFRLKDHIDRLYQSAKIHIQIPFSKIDMVEACKKLIYVNKVESGIYVRPAPFMAMIP